VHVATRSRKRGEARKEAADMLRALRRLARSAGDFRARQLSLGQSAQLLVQNKLTANATAAAKEDYGPAEFAGIPTSSSVVLYPQVQTPNSKTPNSSP